MNNKFLLFIICVIFCSCSNKSTQQIDLSGEWFFALDSNDVGITEKWYENPLAEKIKLPGSLQEQGFGNDVDINTPWTGQIADRSWYTSDTYEKYRQPGNIKIPFWLQPDKHYVGVAWYQCEVQVPSSWEKKYVELELERTHWETTLFVNGEKVGDNNALQTPHRYMINKTGKLLLSIRVDNRLNIPIGINAHSVSDHTQSNWNGIVGNITLTARPTFHIDNIQVYPDVKGQKAKVVVSFAGTSAGKSAQIQVKGKSFNSEVVKELTPVNASVDCKNPQFSCTLDMGDDMLTWSEFEPNLYQLSVEINTEEGKEVKNTTFGMREFKVDGTRFSINGTPVFLRGTLECAIFPLTGYASMDTAYWEKIYRRCKEFGLNHVRFHSWCPPRVAFEVADREGIYLQVEAGGWGLVGDGGSADKWFMEESERIVKEFGNHPSFCVLTYGNEPAGGKQVEYLSSFVDHWKSKDKRRIYIAGAGWPYTPNSDFWSAYDPRLNFGIFGGELNSIINREAPRSDFDYREATARVAPMPSVSHEIGQWCVYPNFKEIPKYTGLLKARNFEIFQETLEDHHLGDLAEKFLFASGRLQTLCYKEEIEAALRTPGFGGFQLLDLHDFPGQGSALVGVLDAFWDPKGYVDGKEYSMFCNRIVPLARMSQMIWSNNEVFRASLEMSYFDKQPLKNASIEWDITDASKKVLVSGKAIKDLQQDNCIPISSVEFQLSEIKEPSKLTLTVRVAGTKVCNRWNFWVYPSLLDLPSEKPYVTSDFNDAIAHAKAGRNVLYCLSKMALKEDKGGAIKVGFSPIFWNTAWSGKQAPHTLGIYCDPTHPVFNAFPNDGYSDYQWWDIVTGSAAIVMDDFPADYRPLVHHIDDWFTNRKLGLLFETKMGKGKMMVCGADIMHNLDKRLSARQFRYSIEKYMSSEEFDPAYEIEPDVIKGLIK